MAIISNSFLLDLIIGLVTIAISIILFFKYTYTYWSRRNIPFLPPKIPLGNSPTLFAKGIGIGGSSKVWYDELKKQGHKFGGVFTVHTPQLLLIDPDYVRDILTVDFHSFSDRGIYHNPKDDPISTNLFSMESSEWKKLRIKLTPTFTSGKMKAMFNSVITCSNNLKEAIENCSQKNDDVDIHEISACFTTDVIGCCAFGLDCNSFKEPNAEFRVEGRSIFEIDFWHSIKLFLSINTPDLARKMGIGSTKKNTVDFFYRIIRDSVRYREDNNISRVDFLQMLIDMKNNVDSNQKLTMDEITANSFLFFVAGFETSANTMSYALLEMSQNIEVQDKLRKEIKEVLSKHNGEITYDSIMEMKFLGQVLDETLRLYPPVPTLNRLSTKDYKMRNTDLVIEKETPILISTLGLHRDPDHWPNPYKWDPERFNDENKKTRHPFVYIPFGDGPRNCIGLRFGLMQTKIGLVRILKDYEISLSPRTILPIGYNPDTFVLFTLNRIYLKVKKL